MSVLVLTSEIKAVFLLIIALSSNFLGNTLNCGLQRLLTENGIIRNLFIFFIIFFTIDFTSKSDLDPVDVIKKSFLIYIFYIILNKQSFESFALLFILMVVVYIIYLKIGYEEKRNRDTKLFNQSLNILLYCIGGIAIIGFGLYYNKQMTEHPNDFDHIKFIFGTKKCDSIM